MSITLKELLENEPREVKVGNLGITVKVRDPTVQDKIDSRIEAKKHPLWKDMDELEQSTEITTRLALKMLVQPKISYENYKKSPSPRIDAIIEAVLWDWSRRLSKITDKTRKEIRDFLTRETEKSQRTSSNS